VRDENNIIYKFKKFGMLVKYYGLPTFLSERPITDCAIVWWFPWNWVLIVIATPVVIFRRVVSALGARKKEAAE